MEQELAIKLQDEGIHYQTQVEIPGTTADFYFPLESRPLLVFVDGRVHLGTRQMAKDEELRSLLRKRGYRIVELFYDGYSDRKRDQLYQQNSGPITIIGKDSIHHLCPHLCNIAETSSLTSSKIDDPLAERGVNRTHFMLKYKFDPSKK